MDPHTLLFHTLLVKETPTVIGPPTGSLAGHVSRCSPDLWRGGVRIPCQVQARGAGRRTRGALEGAGGQGAGGVGAGGRESQPRSGGGARAGGVGMRGRESRREGKGEWPRERGRAWEGVWRRGSTGGEEAGPWEGGTRGGGSRCQKAGREHRGGSALRGHAGRESKKPGQGEGRRREEGAGGSGGGRE